MGLEPGTRIGNYEIVDALGAGGMGEVYRARDVRLERAVAIKAVGEAFSRDAERLARFEREARILASLHHANIAAIHGIEDAAGRSYLVLEFIEGETLAERLARGPLDVDEVLATGAQIAAAIDAAHEQGIVHRDLKPGNVMRTPAGTVKVLDFGLARSLDPQAATPDLSASPTVALSATAAGVILGTAPYMSPEQARGKGVDRRTDVWALGCILFECLSGRQTFAGETTSDVIARILERDPDWGALPATTPPRLRDLIRRCLTKSPEDRPRDVGDLRRELQAIVLERSSPSPARVSDDGIPSVAVLYFENLSADPESDYFCAGITEDILTDLSKLKGMRVTSRNAVARYRGQTVDIPSVARDLNVRAVLEGSVRRAGDRVRISAQLLSADGFHLWAERYDRTLEDVFAVQEEIASSIAAALRVALSPSEAEQLGGSRPKDVRAYDLYLKGRGQYERFDEDGYREALRLFEAAIEIDPDYALAYAGIADVHGQFLQWSLVEDREAAMERGLSAARRAIALNPKLAEGHKAEGLVLRFSGQREAGNESIRRAIQADPRYTPALGNYGVEMFSRGDLAAAERAQRRALEVEPDQPHALLWVAMLENLTGRFDDSERRVSRLGRVALGSFYEVGVHMLRASRCLLLDRLEEIPRHLEALRAVRHGERNADAAEAWIVARTGDEARARALAERATEAQNLNLEGLTFAALTWMRLGEMERAIALMKRPVVESIANVHVRLHPHLHPMLDFAPFAPRRMDATLVWPLEAPMVPASVHRLFRETKIVSGLPEGSDILTAP